MSSASSLAQKAKELPRRMMSSGLQLARRWCSRDWVELGREAIETPSCYSCTRPAGVLDLVCSHDGRVLFLLEPPAKGSVLALFDPNLAAFSPQAPRWLARLRAKFREEFAVDDQPREARRRLYSARRRATMTFSAMTFLGLATLSHASFFLVVQAFVALAAVSLAPLHRLSSVVLYLGGVMILGCLPIALAVTTHSTSAIGGVLISSSIIAFFVYLRALLVYEGKIEVGYIGARRGPVRSYRESRGVRRLSGLAYAIVQLGLVGSVLAALYWNWRPALWLLAGALLSSSVIFLFVLGHLYARESMASEGKSEASVDGFWLDRFGGSADNVVEPGFRAASRLRSLHHSAMADVREFSRLLLMPFIVSWGMGAALGIGVLSLGAYLRDQSAWFGPPIFLATFLAAAALGVYGFTNFATTFSARAAFDSLMLYLRHHWVLLATLWLASVGLRTGLHAILSPWLPLTVLGLTIDVGHSGTFGPIARVVSLVAGAAVARSVVKYLRRRRAIEYSEVVS